MEFLNRLYEKKIEKHIYGFQERNAKFFNRFFRRNFKISFLALYLQKMQVRRKKIVKFIHWSWKKLAKIVPRFHEKKTVKNSLMCLKT